MRKDDVTDNERAENFWQAKYEDLRETTKNDQIEMMSLQKENDELRARVKQLASRIPAWPKNYRPSRPRNQCE